MKATTWLALCAATILTLTAANGRAGILSADLSVAKAVVSQTATPGGQITYNIVAGNAGPNDAAGTTVADTFPAALSNCSWTCTPSAGSSCTAAGSGNINDLVSLLSGGTATYSATCDIDPTATGILSNTATVTEDASITDSNQANNASTADIALTPSADLSISKTDGLLEHTAGTPITYTIVATNNGPSAVGDASVIDNFQAPLSNCSWTSVASGGATGNTNASGNLNDTLSMPVGSSVTYTATCDVSATALGTLSNTASISSAAATDPVPGNDSASDADTTLLPPPPPVVVPTLGIWSLLALLAALALLGGAALRRQAV